MSEQKKERDVIYIDHRGELLIWLIIILAIVILSFVSNLMHSAPKESHSIYLPDVDGLIVGSPVRMMGIEVGHVTNIKPINDEVFVKFMIKDKNIKIPQGTQATVEFSGMAGSKSLELYLPEEGAYIENDTPILSGTPPKKLSDAYGLLNEMFKTVGNIISASSIFGKRMSEIEMPKTGSPQDLKEFLRYANDEIDIQQQRVDNLGRKLNEKERKFKNHN